MKKETIRFLLFCFVFVAIAGIIIYFVFSKFNEEENTPVAINLNNEMNNSITALSIDFTQKATNFGVDISQINEENVFSVYNALESDIDGVNRTRGESYESLTEMIYPTSPISFSPSVYESWPNRDDLTSIVSFASDEISVIEIKNPRETIIDDDDVILADVDIAYTSTLTKIVPGGSDSDWTGDYVVMDRKFPSTMTLTVLFDGEQWFAYDVANFGNIFTTVLWETPDSLAFVNQMRNLNEVGVIQSKELEQLMSDNLA